MLREVEKTKVFGVNNNINFSAFKATIYFLVNRVLMKISYLIKLFLPV